MGTMFRSTISVGLVAVCVACSGSEFSETNTDASAGAAGAGAGGMQTGGSGGTQTGGSGGTTTGGSGGTSTGGNGGTTSGGAAGSTAGAAGQAGAAGSAVDAGVDASGPDGCAVLTFYLDGDQDGWGGTTTASGCTPPDNGNWVTKGGDCDDGNAKVNPGQTGYFVTGYVKTGTSTVSFDYDCSGAETEAGQNPKAGCKVQGLECVGGGYIVAQPVRSGPGVDPYCGSALKVNCGFAQLACKASAPVAAAPIACH